MQKYISLILFLWINSYQLYANPWKPINVSVTFKIKHALGATADGSFGGFTGVMIFDPDNLTTSSLKGSIETKTINTGISLRDRTLRSGDYFDTEKYPKITLQSTKIEKAQQENEYIGYFSLTIKNITKNIRIPFTFVQNGAKATFRGNFMINRTEYGVGTKSSLLSDTAAIIIEIKTQQI
ncbi:YceI family protein [Emticicia sp. BO119]|uniref:YceI family protein n=1 Tax=Emticicia sp. BO119 TaxID=2757768 RepID=UPI0015F027E6|nr:YceI family protein [Emticicia sp. BO119]MBA4849261.1 YceI family protein [Emticicia sp. BO119]